MPAGINHPAERFIVECIGFVTNSLRYPLFINKSMI